MLAVLLAIETTDVIFAVDSIPAIFAVTDEAYLVFTSNAFAILGLRAMYFMLAGAVHRFAYLKVGLAAVLVFVGVKMMVIDIWKVPIALSLAVIASIIAVAIGASLWATRGAPTPDAGAPSGDPDSRPTGEPALVVTAGD
jgi:tellurite resistance protein TerC